MLSNLGRGGSLPTPGREGGWVCIRGDDGDHLASEANGVLAEIINFSCLAPTEKWQSVIASTVNFGTGKPVPYEPWERRGSLPEPGKAGEQVCVHGSRCSPQHKHVLRDT